MKYEAVILMKVLHQQYVSSNQNNEASSKLLIFKTGIFILVGPMCFNASHLKKESFPGLFVILDKNQSVSRSHGSLVA